MMALNAECIKLCGSQTVTRPTALHDIDTGGRMGQIPSLWLQATSSSAWLE